MLQLSNWVRLRIEVSFIVRPTTLIDIADNKFGLYPFRSHYWGHLIMISFPQGTKIFQFPWFASLTG